MRAISGLIISFILPAVAYSRVPDYETDGGVVRIAGIGPDSPIIYDNDWWSDVFDNNYLWAQVSLGEANLRGNVVSRDMWEWRSGYKYGMDDCVRDAREAIEFARRAGLRGIPDLTRGADRALERPESGRIDDTKTHSSAGSRLIADEAMKASPDSPLVVIVGGPLTTVANALLTNPEIAGHLLVFSLTVDSNGYNGKDSWSAYVVAKRTRLVDWATGSFWDESSVFRAEHFAKLPKNEFCEDMRRLIGSGLGRANQLGDGAPLVWLWKNECWTGVRRRRAVWRGDLVRFEEVRADEPADVLDSPKESTDLRACRVEFFRVLADPGLFEEPGSPTEEHSAPAEGGEARD